jgi:TonB-dependent receptor
MPRRFAELNKGFEMTKPLGLVSLLLVSSALVAPSALSAQGTTGGQDSQATATPPAASPPVATTPGETPPAAPAEGAVEEPTDISIPGGGGDVVEEIVVTGRRNTNISRSAAEVVSVLSSADIARTGEGNIAGALGRVTGLSVVGSGFVYVRGLGDRYSLALLNGSPLSSPEPLKRTVPLDLFPTNIIASSLVQKSYSVNFPGEFGGGVINLTTKAIPTESFLTVGGAISGDSESTQQLGYTYFGARSDWTGFDDGSRNTPPALAAFAASGSALNDLPIAQRRTIIGQFFTGQNAVIQRTRKIPFNGSGNITAGTYKEFGDVTVGLIATAGYSNRWRTRDTTQQTASSADLSQKELDFQRVVTDNRIIVNGLLGLGIEWEDNKIRWTNLYIRDTLKQARLGVGTRQTTSLIATLQQQSTAWFERQLIDSHATGEFRLTPELRLDVRGGYANAQREAPNEYSFEYFRSNLPQAADPYGTYFVNRLNNGQSGRAEATFSDLNEDLYSAGADISYKFTPSVTATIGYAYLHTRRRTERRAFLITAAFQQPDIGVALLRPDLLLGSNIVNTNQFGYDISDSETNPVFQASLRNHAGYVQVQADLVDGLELNAGVRYERATQLVTPVQVFTVPVASTASTVLKRNYWLPALTLTYKINPEMQLRLSGSKTIARPQFRELIYQPFYDPESNRQFRGNPLLTDSQLYNAEARYEWYFDRDQRLAVAGFYKKIKNPIETFSSFEQNTVITSFANAPEADLYGVEVETQKYFDLSGLGSGDFWSTRRAVVVANYTYTKSKIKVPQNARTGVFGAGVTNPLATDYFRDGAPLTGQSNHLVNLQLGIEDTEKLSQYTVLFSYASQRVTSRGASLQPDIIEKPGIQLDFVARQGFKIAGQDLEVKFEARNITGTKYQEVQQLGANQVFYNLYKVGTSFSLGLNVNF